MAINTETPPGRTRAPVIPRTLVTRRLRRTERHVTTFGLGGQASIQWQSPHIEAAAIIEKAICLGVTYLDTSNVYGPSQLEYGRAFRRLNLVPNRPGFDGALRQRLFLASKSHLRYALSRDGRPGPRDRTEGAGTTCVDDLFRSLSQIFGDGQGGFPEGAYLDLFQVHDLTSYEEVAAIFEGYDRPDDGHLPHIGFLAGILDFRDGTNHTGLNPRRRCLVRHIGITGHWNAAAHMAALQRDTRNVIDTLLVAINAQDKLYFNHQHNFIALARAKDVGVIGMKVFADGAFFGDFPPANRDNSHFQLPHRGLTEPQRVEVSAQPPTSARVTWSTAYAGDHPIERYEIVRSGHVVARIPFTPQVSLAPFVHVDNPPPAGHEQALEYSVRVVDAAGDSCQSPATPLRFHAIPPAP